MATTAIATVAVTGGIGSPLLAQARPGSFELVVEGTRAMRLDLTADASGVLTGALTVVFEKLPLTGTLRGDRVAFGARNANGVLLAEGRVVGETLDLTLTPQGANGQPNRAAAERHVFTRPGAGWSAESPLAGEWTQRLRGMRYTTHEGLGGGSSGSMITEQEFHFCADGSAVMETRSTTNINVPGATAGGASRKTERGRWRVLSAGTQAALEFTDASGASLQLGVRAGTGGVIYIVREAVQLQAGGGLCR